MAMQLRAPLRGTKLWAGIRAHKALQAVDRQNLTLAKVGKQMSHTSTKKITLTVRAAVRIELVGGNTEADALLRGPMLGQAY
jgi:hypothetical protein